MAVCENYSLDNKRVYVAGHSGMVGSAAVRRLANENCEVITATHSELDLCRQAEVEEFIACQRPHAVICCAAKVGGILANTTYPAEFIYENLAIVTNLTEAAHRSQVEKFVMLGSSCIYPREAAQPVPEEALLTGPLEKTNEWYAIAKIAAIKLLQAYRRQYGHCFVSCMPTNLYGPEDNFDLQTSHVVPALMRKIHEAKVHGRREVEIWGTGRPRREFLYVDDCADAIVHILKNYDQEEPINIGTGKDITIADLAALLAKVIEHECVFRFNSSMPDGTARKLLDVSRLHELGWSAPTSLSEGLAKTYAWFKQWWRKRVNGATDSRQVCGRASSKRA
jgi:GDP-L-fucose synthase